MNSLTNERINERKKEINKERKKERKEGRKEERNVNYGSFVDFSVNAARAPEHLHIIHSSQLKTISISFSYNFFTPTTSSQLMAEWKRVYKSYKYTVKNNSFVTFSKWKKLKKQNSHLPFPPLRKKWVAQIQNKWNKPPFGRKIRRLTFFFR